MFRFYFPHVQLILHLLLATALMTSLSCGSRKIATEDRPPVARSLNAININSASAAELEKLPYVGPALATKIVEHRGRYGPFRKIEHLLVIDGVGDRRFRKMEHLITIE